MSKYPPINPKLPHLIHGADYNPDQWLDRPDILIEDLRLMKQAGCNAMSLGIFSWVTLEPREGEFDFSWLDRIMDGLAESGIFVILATPTAAKPAWLAQKYPEVLRVTADRRRKLQGLRHNHCYTAPAYRERAGIINTKLAGRYGNHPALLMWHISNEYGGECHCQLCQEAFRTWLRRKYDDSLDRLNQAWWTVFWSHTYTQWEQIESPSPIGESLLHGLTIDWKRFVTDQTIDFLRAELAPLREITPNVPVTTNFMGTYPGLNYWKFVDELDVISWDSYPCWHSKGETKDCGHPADEQGRDWRVAADTAFSHSIMRCLKGGRPFMLMESTPSVSNWHPVQKLKRPGMNRLSSFLAVAHGSDTVQYFQWRKSRGSSEKLHGAVVDHTGSENTRIFREVARIGSDLKKLDALVGTTVPAETAIVYDWENRWAIDEAMGPVYRRNKKYEQTCKNHHYPLWALGIPVDVISMDCDFSSYKLVIAPMLYMVREGVAERLETFVEQGGTLVCTYWSGIVDQNDLCFLGGFPGPLRMLLGIWAEEIDALYPQEHNALIMEPVNELGLTGEYELRDFCEILHAETAMVLARYRGDFYRSKPVLTVNGFGKGRAYYLAARVEERFLQDFYASLTGALSLKRALAADLPEGASAQVRSDGSKDYIFLLNFTQAPQTIDLGERIFNEMLTGKELTGRIDLEPFDVKVIT
ncbi:MAG: beta-galactosidase [Spirochaetaceae bacterium]|nr:MAG: beta-galactosidase [Spirochaetaceae bacterium]